jgi:hypothetical protein
VVLRFFDKFFDRYVMLCCEMMEVLFGYFESPSMYSWVSAVLCKFV